MKRYFKFRKDFRCNWYGILGLYDTYNLEKVVRVSIIDESHIWHRCKTSLLQTDKYYCDVFIFESDGETQEYVDKLNETLDGLAYFVKKEDEADAIEELCDYYVVFDDDGHCSITRDYGYFNELHADAVSHRFLGGAYGALRTDKGLIYAAKMNEKGEWELL